MVGKKKVNAASKIGAGLREAQARAAEKLPVEKSEEKDARVDPVVEKKVRPAKREDVHPVLGETLTIIVGYTGAVQRYELIVTRDEVKNEPLIGNLVRELVEKL